MELSTNDNDSSIKRRNLLNSMQLIILIINFHSKYFSNKVLILVNIIGVPPFLNFRNKCITIIFYTFYNIIILY
jgi:hypothetical protein